MHTLVEVRWMHCFVQVLRVGGIRTGKHMGQHSIACRGQWGYG